MFGLPFGTLRCLYPLQSILDGFVYQLAQALSQPCHHQWSWGHTLDLTLASISLGNMAIISGRLAVGNMDLLPDTPNCGLRMRRECREHFPRHRRQRTPQVSDPGMHHGTCVTHGSWCMPRSRNVLGIPGACATWKFTNLVRGPWVWGIW